MSWSAVSAFLVLEFALCVVPGPAVLYTIATTMRGRARAGLAAAAGIATGNTIYFGLSAAGVIALLLASYAAFTAVKFAGVAYLAYLGVRSLLAKPREFDAVATPDSVWPDRTRAFSGAVVTQLANPKAIVFFVAVVPQFVDPRAALPLQIVTLAVVSAAVELTVLGCYVVLADRIRRLPSAYRARLWIERAGGGVLLAVAARIAREPAAAAH